MSNLHKTSSRLDVAWLYYTRDVSIYCKFSGQLIS